MVQCSGLKASATCTCMSLGCEARLLACLHAHLSTGPWLAPARAAHRGSPLVLLVLTCQGQAAPHAVHPPRVGPQGTAVPAPGGAHKPVSTRLHCPCHWVSPHHQPTQHGEARGSSWGPPTEASTTPWPRYTHRLRCPHFLSLSPHGPGEPASCGHWLLLCRHTGPLPVQTRSS